MCILYRRDRFWIQLVIVVFLLFKLTRIQNGMAVVGHETHSPVVTLAVIYNAGARHESADDVGLTHCLRMAVNQVLFIWQVFDASGTGSVLLLYLTVLEDQPLPHLVSGS